MGLTHMKYAIIQIGGKQYIVKEGDTVSVSKLKANDGEEFEIKEVLALFDDTGENAKIGAPFAPNASVKAKALESGKGKKMTVIKFKPKVRYKRKKGHRQEYTKILINKIMA